MAVQPLGFGVSLAVGEILDPVNDLVETFSSVMLTASVAFGIQKLLLAIGSNWVVSACLSAIALVWAVLFWMNRSPQWLFRLLGVLLFIRFVMPVATIGSAKLFEAFSSAQYTASQGELDKTANDLKVFGATVEGRATATEQTAPPASAPTSVEEAPAPEPTLASRMLGTLQGAQDSAVRVASSVAGAVKDPLGTMRRKSDDVKRQYEEIKRAAEAAVERMITLIVIFLMQTVIVPTLLLLGLYWLCRDLFRVQPAEKWQSAMTRPRSESK
ncbi:hypothetical protein [Hydrogenophaga sp. OTU3427]|uniref:hypothetical protein n=1 Tax=Hydrogenophaga sp. OTU3427 TaxID=3043856 RepID=UPI00313BF2AB